MKKITSLSKLSSNLATKATSQVRTHVRAFTLIELLIVIVIIGILATIGVAQFNKYQEKARYARALSFHNQVTHKMDTFLEEKIGYWPMDIDENPRPDYSGMKNHLTRQQSTIESGEGFCYHESSQGCEKITGNGSYRNDAVGGVNMPAKNTENPNEFTLSFWMKIEDFGTSDNVQGPHFSNVSPAVYHDFRPRVQIGSQAIYISKKVVSDKWFHFLVTYDGLKLKIYNDGMVYYDNVVPAVSQNIDFSDIAAFKSGYSTNANVWVDDIHLWGHALDF